MKDDNLYYAQPPNFGVLKGCVHTKLYLTVESITVPTCKKFKKRTTLSHVIKCTDCPQEWKQDATRTS